MRAVGAHSNSYETTVLGKEIIVYPDVFSPKYFLDAWFFAEEVPKIVGTGTFCEVGVGTGIVALFVGLNGATRIVGTDINSKAIENTRENFRRHNLTVTLYEGNVLDPIPFGEKFDFIFWNHPFNNVEGGIPNMLLRSVFDQGFVGLKHYFATAANYLAPGGKLILGSGEIADQSEILRLASESLWLLEDQREQESKVRVGGDRPMRLFIYTFGLSGDSQ